MHAKQIPSCGFFIYEKTEAFIRYLLNTNYNLCMGDSQKVVPVFALGVKKTGSWDPIGLKKRGPQNKNGTYKSASQINSVSQPASKFLASGDAMVSLVKC